MAWNDERHAERWQLPAVHFRFDDPRHGRERHGVDAPHRLSRGMDGERRRSGQRVILLVESTDKRLRNRSTRWRGEVRDGALQLEQTGSKACDPTRAGTLKKS